MKEISFSKKEIKYLKYVLGQFNYTTDNSLCTNLLKKLNDADYKIPNSMKDERITNRELAEWLAKGNGELCMGIYEAFITTVSNEFSYLENKWDAKVDMDIRVRKWGKNECWHEPTYGYCGVKRR